MFICWQCSGSAFNLPRCPDPASECGSGSSFLSIGAKSPNLPWSAKFSETLVKVSPTKTKLKIFSRCQRKSLLFKNNNWKIPYTGVLLTVDGQVPVHGSGSALNFFLWIRIRIRIKLMRVCNTARWVVIFSKILKIILYNWLVIQAAKESGAFTPTSKRYVTFSVFYKSAKACGRGHKEKGNCEGKRKEEGEKLAKF